MMNTIVDVRAADCRIARTGAAIADRIRIHGAALPLLATALAMLAACERQLPEPRRVPVMAKVLTHDKVVMSRRYSGSIAPLQSTSLAFKLSGTVRSLYRPIGLDRDVQVGDTLAKGTVIAELDEGDLRRAKTGAAARVAQLEARVATAKDTLAIATRNLVRFDNSSGSVSRVARDEVETRRVAAAGEVEAAEHALADARVQLDQAIDDYENRRLVVPFDRAMVAAKNIEAGERKAAHEVAFRLIDVSTVYVDFGVPDVMVGTAASEASPAEHITIGQKLVVTADAFDGRVFEGTVTKIAPEADPVTRTFLTQLTLPNLELGHGQPLLRPGMIVTVLVGAHLDREAMLLPMTAIHRGRAADELMVYEVVTEYGHDIARARRVAVGGVFNNDIEILPDVSEVSAGARIVLTTGERLANGIPVRVVLESSDPAAKLPEAQ